MNVDTKQHPMSLAQQQQVYEATMLVMKAEKDWRQTTPDGVTRERAVVNALLNAGWSPPDEWVVPAIIQSALDSGYLVETGRDDQGVYYQAPPRGHRPTAEELTDRQKNVLARGDDIEPPRDCNDPGEPEVRLLDRLMGLYNMAGRLASRLYSPNVSMVNSQWTDDQVLQLAPDLVDLAKRAADEIEAALSAVMREVRDGAYR